MNVRFIDDGALPVDQYAQTSKHTVGLYQDSHRGNITKTITGVLSISPGSSIGHDGYRDIDDGHLAILSHLRHHRSHRLRLHARHLLQCHLDKHRNLEGITARSPFIPNQPTAGATRRTNELEIPQESLQQEEQNPRLALWQRCARLP